MQAMRIYSLTSNGIEQLPQYCRVNGYEMPSFGPHTKCSGISVMFCRIKLLVLSVYVHINEKNAMVLWLGFLNCQSTIKMKWI